MKALFFQSCLVGCALLGGAFAETWTAADGERTMEADFIKLEGDRVTMRLSNMQITTFHLNHLSVESQQRVKELAAAQNPAEQAEETQLQEDFGKLLKKLDDEDLEKFEFEQNPQYFILYYSASWCGPCRNMIGNSVNYYNDTIADNPAIELVMVSADHDEQSTQKWANEENMPWPILLKQDRGKVDAATNNSVGSIPHMALIDGEGNSLASGIAAVKKKVKELAEEEK